MIDTNKFQGKMREKKYTLKTLSAALGMSSCALFKKIHNVSEFYVSEMVKITSILELSHEEQNAIFFADKRACDATKRPV